MINFVVSDLETALVPNGEKMVQEETIELIMELKEKGVYFAVATGRNYDAVYPMFGKAKDHIVYICNDGGSVIYRDKVISKTPLDRLVCLEVANELEKNRDYKLLFSGERNAVVTTRDIDFINKIKLDKEYQARTRTWKDYNREEQAELIMKYVDDIELSLVGTEIVVNQINFRESICKPCQELFDKGYIDTIKPAIFGNVVGNIRFSNYLSEEEFGEVIMRLRQYYDVGYTEAIYYLDKQMFYFNFVEDNSAIVRVFPLKDYYKLDPDCKMKTYEFGIIYIREEDKFQMQEIDTAFDYIPDETNNSVIYSKDTTTISVGVKPVKFCEDDAEEKN